MESTQTRQDTDQNPLTIDGLLDIFTKIETEYGRRISTFKVGSGLFEELHNKLSSAPIDYVGEEMITSLFGVRIQEVSSLPQFGWEAVC